MIYKFDMCSSLTSITIPNSVTTIGSGAFAMCSSLTSITIPNSVTTIGDSMFLSCEALHSVNIPNSVTTIGDYAFAYCSGIASMNISEGITSIGGGAFWGCGGLTSVTIPNSVTSIGNCAFLGCPNLTSIISWISSTFAIPGMHDSTRTFDSRIYDKATIFVPIGTVDLYKKTYGWKDFWHIEEMDGTTGIENYNRETITDNRYFNLNGQRIEGQPTKKGVYIKNGKKVLMK